MARPKAQVPDAGSVRALIDAQGYLAVRVTPGARSEGAEIAQGQLSVKVRAKPEDGKANEAVRTLLAKMLGIAPSRIELVRGATLRDKQFRIGG